MQVKTFQSRSVMGICHDRRSLKKDDQHLTSSIHQGRRDADKQAGKLVTNVRIQYITWLGGDVDEGVVESSVGKEMSGWRGGE